MTAIPGTPQIQNTIPMAYFGTDTFAAPILGIIAALIMLLGGMFWLTIRLKKAKEAGVATETIRTKPRGYRCFQASAFWRGDYADSCGADRQPDFLQIRFAGAGYLLSRRNVQHKLRRCGRYLGIDHRIDHRYCTDGSVQPQQI